MSNEAKCVHMAVPRDSPYARGSSAFLGSDVATKAPIISHAPLWALLRRWLLLLGRRLLRPAASAEGFQSKWYCAVEYVYNDGKAGCCRYVRAHMSSTWRRVQIQWPVARETCDIPCKLHSPIRAYCPLHGEAVAGAPKATWRVRPLPMLF
jgi:hypothetical protein